MTKKTTATTTYGQPAALKQTEGSKALALQLARQVVGYHVGPQPPEAYEKPTNIVTAANGVFRVVKTPIGLFKTKIAEAGKDIEIPGVAAMEEGVELLIPKIPFKYWLQVLSWYKDVYTKDKTEASILFFWNHDEIEISKTYSDGTEVKGLTEDGQLIIYCPEQKNSSGLSQFGTDGMVTYLREHTTPLLETHSHHTMGAFWSATDNANENMTQFYGVYGKITSAEPEFLFRYVSGDSKINCDHSVLFDVPQVKTTVTVRQEFDIEGMEPVESTEVEYSNASGPWPMVEYPGDWMGQHSRSYTYSSGYPKGPANKQDGGAVPSRAKSWANSGAYDHYYEEEGYDGYNYPLGGYDGYGSGRSADKKHTASNHGSSDVKKNGLSVKEIVVKGENSVAEVEDANLLDTHSAHELHSMLQEMCEFGYDYIMLDVIKQQFKN